MTDLEKEALDVLREVTKKADERLKMYFSSRSEECYKDYYLCKDLIAKLEKLEAQASRPN